MLSNFQENYYAREKKREKTMKLRHRALHLCLDLQKGRNIPISETINRNCQQVSVYSGEKCFEESGTGHYAHSSRS